MKHKNALTFIFFTLLLDIIGWGIIIPVLPGFITELTGDTVSQASKLAGWLAFTFSIVQFFFAPILGNLSDQFGRRPVLLFSLFGFSIDYILIALAPTITWLFIARVISGITGASITTAQAYIADISTDETRTKNFGMVGAAFGLGFIIGPVIGGFMGQFGTRVPFYAAAILCFLNFLYGYFFVPESLAIENRRKFDWKRANPIGSLMHLKKYPAILGLVASLSLVYIAAHAVQSNWSFYSIFRYNWNSNMVGISLGIVGLLVGLVQGVLVRYVNPKIGNEKSIYLGLGLYAVGMMCFGLATTGTLFLIALLPYCLGGIAGPALQSILSGGVPPNEQGELQGALTSIISVTSIIGPPVMTGIFYYFTKPDASTILPGAPFFLGAMLMSLSSFLAYRALHINKKVELN